VCGPCVHSFRPKKTLLDDLISANKDNKAKDSGRGDAEEIGTFADSDDKQYFFQKGTATTAAGLAPFWLLLALGLLARSC
jgi:hypothetical protein